MARGKKAEEKAAKGNAKGSQKRKAEEEEDAEVEDEDEELELTEEDDDKAAEEAEGDNDKENQGKKEKAKETSKKASPRQGEGAGGGDDGAASRASKKSKESSGDGDGDGGDAHSRVLLYMRRANRPYSCTVLFENLHHEIGKAALQRILDDLTTQSTQHTHAHTNAHSMQPQSPSRPSRAASSSPVPLSCRGAEKLTMKEFGKAALYWLTQVSAHEMQMQLHLLSRSLSRPSAHLCHLPAPSLIAAS